MKTKNKLYKNYAPIILGVLLIIIGIGYIGNAMDWWKGFSIFFDGWWSLFIIVPCIIRLVNTGFNIGVFIPLVIGIYFLIASQTGFSIMWKFSLPATFIIVGIIIILNSKFFKFRRVINDDDGNSFYIPVYSGIVSPKNVIVPAGEIFHGATLSAVCAGVSLNLYSAIVQNNVVLEANAWFAPVEIVVPSDVNILVSCVPIFGTVHNTLAQRILPEGTPTVYINGKALFGTIMIK